MSVTKAVRFALLGVVIYALPITIVQMVIGYGDIVEWLRKQPVINNVIFWTSIAVPLIWNGVHGFAEWRSRKYRVHIFLDADGEATAYLLRRKRLFPLW